MLQGKDGHYLNMGGGVDDDVTDELLVNGSAEYKTDATTGETYIDWHGQRIDPAPDQEMGISGTGFAVCATDWEKDGDLNLVVGTIDGEVWLIPNEGTPQDWSFGKERAL